MEELASLGFISVIPAILAIVLSFATKNTIVALAIACITGTTLTGLAQGTNLLETLLLGFPTLLKENLGNTSFSWVMLLNTFIGILVAYFQKTGAIQGFSQWVHDKHLSRRGAQLAAWVLGMFVYFSDSFSPLFVGCTMRSITDKARISREKLAYIADSTSAPVSVLVPITGWAAYLSGLAVGVGCIATQEEGSALFLRAIPFNFYPIFAVILVGEKASSVYTAVDHLNAVFMKVMELILKLSPIGVFCLLCPVIAENGAAIIGSLAMVLLTAYICYAIHAILVYSTTVRAMGGLSPLKFFKGMLPAMMFAFSSASSVGTLPLNIECTEKLGADRQVSSFVLPLGATINMDGTAIYQGVCAIFIASCYGISLTFPQMLTIVLTATLASIGTAGVPGAGMVMLAMVLTSVGLPVDGIALVAGVDRLFDMGRTVLNITGDASCAIVVSNLEKKREAKKIEKQA